jgi:hypothetical protein
METVRPDHPQLELLFAIDGEISDEAIEAMHRAVDRLAGSRS